MSRPRQFEYIHALSKRRIRLLKLSYGSESGQLCFNLSEFDLEGCPPFTALSYAWGDPEDKKLALCNNCSVSITNSLCEALWQMHEDGEQGYIWADALCINQQDDVEKTSQVRMMGNIYEAARIVVIWLGPENPGDRASLFLMKEICDIIKLGSTDDHEWTVDIHAAGLYDIASERWVAMVKFLRKPWFWRLWVIQEYQKSRDRVFRCGRISIMAGFFMEFYFLMGKCPELKSLTQLKGLEAPADAEEYLFAPFFEIQKFLDLQRNWPPGAPAGAPLHGMLSKSRGCQSSDPRDRVFAVVGLSSDTNVDLIDYQASLSNVLIRISVNHIRAMVASTSTADCFNYLCFIHEDNVESLPSWVPSFNLPQSFWNLNCIFRTEKSLDDKPNIRLDNDALLIAGLVVDHIKTIIDNGLTSKAVRAMASGDFKDGLARTQEILNYVNDIWGLAMKQVPYPTKEDTLDVFWKSLVFDTGDVNIRTKSTPDMRRSFESWHESLMLSRSYMQIGVQVQDGHPPLPSQSHFLETLQDASPLTKWKPSRLEPDRIIDGAFLEQLRGYVRQGTSTHNAFINPFTRFSMGRRYFASDRGYVGWVPRHAREGDRICAFYGSRFPFVVRPCRDGWTLVGACFMHGLMEGEAIDLPGISSEHGEMIMLI